MNEDRGTALKRRVLPYVAATLMALGVGAGLDLGLAEAGEFDGRWVGKAVSQNCAVRAKIVMDVEGDKVVGRWAVQGTGNGNGSYRFRAQIKPSGVVSRARAGGVYDFQVLGDLTEGGGYWSINIRNCKGRWTVARVDPPPEVTVATREVEITPAPAPAEIDRPADAKSDAPREVAAPPDPVVPKAPEPEVVAVAPTVEVRDMTAPGSSRSRSMADRPLSAATAPSD
jgi:hypothetical protein